MRLLLLSHFLLAYSLTVLPASTAAQSKQTPKVKTVSEKSVVFREIGSLPPVLKEASGLAITQNYLWSHNDGGVPAIYCLDTLGKLVKAIHINASNRGWESLTLNTAGDMFIGSFGNNRNDRRNLKIFKIRNPEAIEDPVVVPEVISFAYSDQKEFPPTTAQRNFDVDAFIALKDNLYLFTKDRSTPFRGISKVYKLSQVPGHQSAQLLDSLYVGKGSMLDNWITGADTSPDGRTVALLFHDRVWFIRNVDENKFSSGDIYEVRLNHYSHKAGIAFKTDTLLYIVDELELGVVGGKLYSLDITWMMKEISE